MAASELGRLTNLGKIYWYPAGGRPIDLRSRPLQPIMWPGEVCIVRGWANSAFCLNRVLGKPDLACSTLDRFLRILFPSTLVVGLEWLDCIPRLLVARSRRRFLGVQCLVPKFMGLYLFLPLGLGPSSGRNDRRAKEVLRAANLVRPSLRAIDFVDVDAGLRQEGAALPS